MLGLSREVGLSSGYEHLVSPERLASRLDINAWSLQRGWPLVWILMLGLSREVGLSSGCPPSSPPRLFVYTTKRVKIDSDCCVTFSLVSMNNQSQCVLLKRLTMYKHKCLCLDITVRCF